MASVEEILKQEESSPHYKSKIRVYENRYIRGTERSLKEFAKAQGLSHATVKSYSSKYNWVPKRNAYWRDKDVSAFEVLQKSGDIPSDKEDKDNKDYKVSRDSEADEDKGISKAGLKSLIEASILRVYNDPDPKNQQAVIKNLITYLEFLNKDVTQNEHFLEANNLLQPLLEGSKCNIESELKQRLGLKDITELANLT